MDASLEAYQTHVSPFYLPFIHAIVRLLMMLPGGTGVNNRHRDVFMELMFCCMRQTMNEKRVSVNGRFMQQNKHCNRLGHDGSTEPCGRWFEEVTSEQRPNEVSRRGNDPRCMLSECTHSGCSRNRLTDRTALQSLWFIWRGSESLVEFIKLRNSYLNFSQY